MHARRRRSMNLHFLDMAYGHARESDYPDQPCIPAWIPAWGESRRPEAPINGDMQSAQWFAEGFAQALVFSRLQNPVSSLSQTAPSPTASTNRVRAKMRTLATPSCASKARISSLPPRRTPFFVVRGTR